MRAHLPLPTTHTMRAHLPLPTTHTMRDPEMSHPTIAPPANIVTQKVHETSHPTTVAHRRGSPPVAHQPTATMRAHRQGSPPVALQPTATTRAHRQGSPPTNE